MNLNTWFSTQKYPGARVVEKVTNIRVPGYWIRATGNTRRDGAYWRKRDRIEHIQKKG